VLTSQVFVLVIRTLLVLVLRSLVDENLRNFSFSFSHLLVLVTQVSHQNECNHTR